MKNSIKNIFLTQLYNVYDLISSTELVDILRDIYDIETNVELVESIKNELLIDIEIDIRCLFRAIC